MTARSATMRSYFAIILAALVVAAAGIALTPAPAWAQAGLQNHYVNPQKAGVGDTITYEVEYRDDDDGTDDDATTSNVVLYPAAPPTSEEPGATIELEQEADEEYPVWETWNVEGSGDDTPHGLWHVNFEFENADGAVGPSYASQTIDINDPPEISVVEPGAEMQPVPYGRADERLDLPHGLCAVTDNSQINAYVEVTDPDGDPIDSVEYRLLLNGSAHADLTWTEMSLTGGRWWAELLSADLPATGDQNVYTWQFRATDAPAGTSAPSPRMSDPVDGPPEWNFWVSTADPTLISVDENNQPYPYPTVTPDDSYAGSIGAGSSSSTFDFRFRYSHTDGLYPRGMLAGRRHGDDRWNPDGDQDEIPIMNSWPRGEVVVIFGDQSGTEGEHFCEVDTTMAGQSSVSFSSYPTEQWVNDEAGVVFKYTVEPRFGNWDSYYPDMPEGAKNTASKLSMLLPEPIMSLTDWQPGSVFRNMFTAFADTRSLGNQLIGGITSPASPLTLWDGELEYFGRTTADYRMPREECNDIDSASHTFEVDGALSQGGYSATLLDGETPSWEPNTDNAPQVYTADRQIARDYWPYPNLNHSRTRSTDTYDFWVRSHEYTDSPPEYVALFLDGQRYLMSAESSGSPSDGVWYRHSLSGLEPGPHDFRFESNNTQRTAGFPTRNADEKLGMLRVNNPPMLSDGGVDPATGEEGTAYTYSVTYTDGDGDRPHQAFCNIFDPMENSGDGLIDATDSAGPYTITDTEANWEDDALVNRFVKITSSDVAPKGTAMGWYYRITGNTADTVTVTLPDAAGYNYQSPEEAFDAIATGDRYRVVRRAQMLPEIANPTSRDFQSGVLYTYEQNQLSNELDEPKEYRYSFTFQDRWEDPQSPGSELNNWYPHGEPGEFVSMPAGDGFGVSGAMAGGPTVEAANVAPELSEPSVDPLEGTTNDTYRFEVTFTDANNDTPSAINLRTSSTADSTEGSEDFGTFANPVAMTEVNDGDLVTTDGKRYYAEINLPLGDSYAFTVRATDGKAASSETTYDYDAGDTPFEEHGGKTGVFGPTVGPNTAPMVDDVNFATAEGDPSTEDFYRETRTQPVEEVPGSPFAPLSEVAWYLEYRDEDGHAPADGFPRIYFDGVAYPMEKVIAEDDDYAADEDNFPRSAPDGVAEGVRYQFNNEDLDDGAWALGTHSYFFLANDGEDQVRLPASGSYTVEITNTPPVLSDPGVSPGIGTDATTFSYQITYTDADDNPPAEVRLLTSTNADPTVPEFGDFQEPREMVEQDPDDTDYTDGKIYEYEATEAPPPGLSNAFTFMAGDDTTSAEYGDDFIEIGAAHGVFGPQVASIGEIRFTDAGGADVDIYEEGDTVYLEVTDADENVDKAGADQIGVVVSDVAGDSEIVTLTETGAETGVFTGSIETLGAAGEANDGTLNVIAGPDGSEITAVWEDADEADLDVPAAEDTAIVEDTTAPARIAEVELLLSAGASGTSIDLDWSAYDEAAQVDVAGYHVWQAGSAFNDTSGMTPIATVPSGTQTYTVTGLDVGNEYWFAVSPFDEVPNEDALVNAKSQTTEDEAGPYIQNEAPAPGATDVAPDTDISFEVFDDGEGVDESSIRVWVDGDEVTGDLVTSAIMGGGYEVSYSPPEDFDWGATVSLEVSVADNAGNTLEADWSFETRADNEPPQVTQRTFDAAAGTMGFHITDNLSGVDTSAITLLVDGEDVTGELAINDRNPLDVSVSYEDPDGWGVNRTVEFAVDAADNAGNAMPTDTWQRDAEVDETGPEFDQFVPAEGATAVGIDSVISVRISDTGSGVDRDSVTLVVDGTDVTADLTFDDSGSSDGMDQTVITYEPPADLDYEADYTVEVAAGDVAGNASSHDWTFTTMVEPTFEIRGTILDRSDNAIPGVEVRVDGNVAVTNGNGAYRLQGLTAGEYTVTPSKDEYDFEPVSRTVTIGPDARDIDFVGEIRTYTISGTVMRGGEPVAGVNVSDGTRTAVTNAQGEYAIDEVPSGVYTVTPTRDADDDGYQDFTYTPENETVNVDGADVTDVDFRATPVTYEISGTISDNDGNRIAGVTVSDGTRTAITNEAGEFTISGVPASTVTLTPTKAGLAFDPETRDVTVPPSSPDNNFIAYQEFTHRFRGGLQMAAVPAAPPAGRDRAVDVFQTDTVARWDAQSSPAGYVFGGDNPDALQLEVSPGAAFFVNFPGVTDVTVPGDPVSTTSTYSVGVASGWNQIGNMYETALPLKNVTGAGSTQIRPFAFIWDGNAGSYRLISREPAFNSARTYIEAWEGAWFKATGAAGTLNIQPPTGIATASMLEGAAARAESPENGWLINVVARVQNRADVTSMAGVGSGDTSLGYEVANPPMLPGTIDVYFTDDSGERLAHDIRPQSSGQMIWPFTVETDIANAEVELTLPDLSGVPAEKAVYLVDKDSDKRMYARTLPAYSFTTGDDGALRHFELEVAPRGADNLTIRSASVQSSDGGVMVTYDLSAPANVSVEVLNIAGRSVRQLIQSRAASAGINEQMWDMRSGDGTLVPNGSYLIKVEAVAENGQRVHALRPAQITR